MTTPEDVFQRLTLKDDPDAADIYRRLVQRGGGDGERNCANASALPALAEPATPKHPLLNRRCGTGQTIGMVQDGGTWIRAIMSVMGGLLPMRLCAHEPRIKCDPTKYITVTFENHAYGEYLKRSRLIADNSPVPIMGDAKE